MKNFPPSSLLSFLNLALLAALWTSSNIGTYPHLRLSYMSQSPSFPRLLSNVRVVWWTVIRALITMVLWHFHVQPCYILSRLLKRIKNVLLRSEDNFEEFKQWQVDVFVYVTTKYSHRFLLKFGSIHPWIDSKWWAKLQAPNSRCQDEYFRSHLFNEYVFDPKGPQSGLGLRLYRTFTPQSSNFKLPYRLLIKCYSSLLCSFTCTCYLSCSIALSSTTRVTGFQVGWQLLSKKCHQSQGCPKMLVFVV